MQEALEVFQVRVGCTLPQSSGQSSDDGQQGTGWLGTRSFVVKYLRNTSAQGLALMKLPFFLKFYLFIFTTVCLSVLPFSHACLSCQTVSSCRQNCAVFVLAPSLPQPFLGRLRRFGSHSCMILEVGPPAMWVCSENIISSASMCAYGLLSLGGACPHRLHRNHPHHAVVLLL